LPDTFGAFNALQPARHIASSAAGEKQEFWAGFEEVPLERRARQSFGRAFDFAQNRFAPLDPVLAQNLCFNAAAPDALRRLTQTAI
jgi:hypothetical protein